jgi:hypothetical protein
MPFGTRAFNLSWDVMGRRPVLGQDKHERRRRIDRAKDGIGVELPSHYVARGDPALDSVALESLNDAISDRGVLRGVADEYSAVANIGGAGYRLCFSPMLRSLWHAVSP